MPLQTGSLASTERESAANPEAEHELTYDSARKACAALIAQQGLRTEVSGHHVTTEEVSRVECTEYSRVELVRLHQPEWYEQRASARALHGRLQSVIDDP